MSDWWGRLIFECQTELRLLFKVFKGIFGNFSTFSVKFGPKGADDISQSSRRWSDIRSKLRGYNCNSPINHWCVIQEMSSNCYPGFTCLKEPDKRLMLDNYVLKFVGQRQRTYTSSWCKLEIHNFIVCQFLIKFSQSLLGGVPSHQPNLHSASEAPLFAWSAQSPSWNSVFQQNSG